MHKPYSKTEIRRLNEAKSAPYTNNGHIAFLLQDVTDPINVGAIFRTAEAINAEILLTGQTPQPPDNSLSMTARGTERKVPWIYHAEFSDAVSQVKDLNYQVVGVELTKQSQPFDQFKYSKNCCLVLGNEADGIYKKNLNLLDASIYMPMLGKGPSLNVETAASIAGYQCLSFQKSSAE